jgi:2-methylcitrate dehydratase PrpD
MIVKKIADFIVNLKYDDISDDALKQIKLAFIDYIGVYLRGRNEMAPQILKESIGLMDHNYEDSILADAMFMGVSSHVLDLDDGHDVASVHLGTVAFSTAIAMSRKLEVSGKEFIEAILAGYETGILIGSIANPNHRNQGFHSTGTIGTYVAGAVASKILRLNLYQTIQCLGLCGTQSAGLLESDHQGTMAKAFHSANAARAGIVSAFLAYNGFTGAESIIDGDEGFLKAMALGDVRSGKVLKEVNKNRIKRNMDSFGKFLQTTDVYFKLYPFCRHIHSSIESSLYLHNTIKKQYDAIESVEIFTYKIASEHDNYKPRNKEELRQSLPYAVAIGLVCGEVGLTKINYLIEDGLFKEIDEVEDEKVIDIKKLVPKIVIHDKKEFDSLEEGARPSNLKIHLNEDFIGGTFEHTTIYSKGNKHNPVSPGEVIDKFRKLNPNYGIQKLNKIDYMESSRMDEVIKLLIDSY